MKITYMLDSHNVRRIKGSDIPNGQFFLADAAKTTALFHRGFNGRIYWVSTCNGKEQAVKNGIEESYFYTPEHVFTNYQPVDVELIVTRSKQ